jgi:predicted small lipoprotein YifL
MRRIAFVLTLFALAACGVDGEPQAPAAKAPAPGVSISGEASVGVVGTL